VQIPNNRRRGSGLRALHKTCSCASRLFATENALPGTQQTAKLNSDLRGGYARMPHRALSNFGMTVQYDRPVPSASCSPPIRSSFGSCQFDTKFGNLYGRYVHESTSTLNHKHQASSCSCSFFIFILLQTFLRRDLLPVPTGGIYS
jgi:hypothetical protein